MSIVIKTLKNTKKISRDLNKTLKRILINKPNARIGFDWRDDFLKVSNNLKKIKKLDWSQSKIFPLAVYKEKQVVPLDKDLIEKFLNEINFNKINYSNIAKMLEKMLQDHKENDLFLFNTLGGVDLLMFFIDSRGNFIYNDFESKKHYLNKTTNANVIISAGIKSILKARKIICFCIDDSSKDIVFKLNKKFVDEDDILTYLHLHNDVTLYTLNSIIQKSEVNNDLVSQNLGEIKNKLYATEDDYIFFDEEIKDENELNSKELNLDANNENMSNLDKELEEINLVEDDIEQDDDVEKTIQKENQIDQVLNKKENNLFNYEKKKEVEDKNLDFENDENAKEIVLNEENVIETDNLEINLSLDDDNFVEKEIEEIKHENTFIKNKINFQTHSNYLPSTREELIKYIQIKKETLNQIENIILKSKLQELKHKTQEKYWLLQQYRQTNPNKPLPKEVENDFFTSKEANKEKQEIEEFKSENTTIDIGVENNNSKYRFNYYEGLRPVPMLMVWHDKNESFYLDLKNEMHESLNISFDFDWIDEYDHVWNDGCYIIYDKANQLIKAMAFRDVDRLLFLLRYINKNLTFIFDSQKDYETIKNFSIYHEDEIKVEEINE